MGKYDKRKKKRKLSFKFLKLVTRVRYKKPTFMFLGEEFKDGSIILSNHEGTDVPMSLEIYCKSYLRFWGNNQMNEGLKKMYKYQSETYYPVKKGWNKTLSKLFCLLASPLTNIFYSGLNLISTYKDIRFTKTLKESIKALNANESIVIFPEDSSNGYLPEVEYFYKGFIKLAEYALKKDINAPIYVMYYKKKERIFVIDKPIYYKDLLKTGLSEDEIAFKFLSRCNELGKMEFTKEELKKAKKEYYK